MQKQTTARTPVSPLSPTSAGSHNSARSPISPALSSTSASSTTQRLNDLLSSFPQWNDPLLVQSLFAPLPSRSSKPEAFAQKFNFWHDVLLSALRQRLLAGSSAFSIGDTRGLGQKYFKNYGVAGLYPICIPGVLKEMIRNGSAVCRLEEVRQRRDSWFSKLFSFFAANEADTDDTDDFDDDDSNATDSLPESLILLPLLNEQLLLLKEHFAASPSLTLPFTQEQFKAVVNACRQQEGLSEIVSADDLQLLLKYLSVKGFIYHSEQDNVVKLTSRGPITQMDKEVVRVRGVADRLSTQITRYSQSAALIRSSAAQKAAIGDRSGALLDLKRVAAIDASIKERMGALSNFDALLLKIEGAQDDVAVMEAYKSGSGLLKRLLADLEGAEGVVDEAAWLMGEAQEKGALFSSEQGEAGLDELEAELAKLVVVEDKKVVEEKKVTELPVEASPVEDVPIESKERMLEAA